MTHDTDPAAIVPRSELRSEIRALVQEKQQLRILVAWQAAVLSEGAAAQLLGVDRLEARTMLQQVLADVGPAWSEYRAEHPVVIGEEA